MAAKDDTLQIYDIAISLGRSCTSRYQISRAMWRKRHGIRLVSQRQVPGEFDIIHAHLDWGSFFFDWSVTPLLGIVKTLESSFSGIFSDDNISVVPRPNHPGQQAIVDGWNGFQYSHAFSEGLAGRLDEKTVQKKLPKLRGKMQYLAAKTEGILQSKLKVLLVRCCDGSEEEFKALHHLLHSRYPLLDYTILYLPYKNGDMPGKTLASWQWLDQMDRMMVFPVQALPYPGSLEEWDAIFDRIDLASPMESDQVFETLRRHFRENYPMFYNDYMLREIEKAVILCKREYAHHPVKSKWCYMKNLHYFYRKAAKHMKRIGVR